MQQQSSGSFLQILPQPVSQEPEKKTERQPRQQKWGGILALLCMVLLLSACGSTNSSANIQAVTSTPAAQVAVATPTDTPTPVPTLAPTPTPTAVPQPTHAPAPVSTPKPKPVVYTVYISNTGYSPSTLTIKVGSIVIWVNNSSRPHTVTGGGISSGNIGVGQRFSFTFTHAGSYSYVCAYHPDMSGGTVIVS